MLKFIALVVVLLVVVGARLARRSQPEEVRFHGRLAQVPVRGDEDRVARAALIVMRGIVPAESDVPRNRVRIHPGSETLTAEEAARRISAMEKPIHCDPRLVGDVLEISCEAAGDEYEPDLRVQRSDVSTGELYSQHERERMATGDPHHILLVGRGESLDLSREEYERLWLDYVFTGYFCVPRSPAYFGEDSTRFVAAREFAPCTSPTTVTVTHSPGDK